MSIGRSWARRRRRMIRDMLRCCIECSLRWLQTGCLRLSEAPIGRILRQLAAQAAKEACCTSPLEFSGDKRGFLREVLANIVNRVPPSLNLGSVHVLGLRSGVTTAAYSVAHHITNRTDRSRLCRFSGRLSTKVDRAVIQCSRSHRGAFCSKLLQCLYASEEIRGATDGEMQAGSGFLCQVTPAPSRCLVVRSQYPKVWIATIASHRTDRSRRFVVSFSLLVHVDLATVRSPGGAHR